MALLVKKVVVTEVVVDTVLLTIDSNRASLHGADSKVTGWATRPDWMPDVLDIDIETGLIRNWEAPTADELQSMVDDAPPIHYATKRTTEKDLSAAVESNDANPATTTPEIQQPVEVATPVQPEVAEIAPEAPQVDSDPADSNMQKLHTAELGQPSEAFDEGVAIAESVLAPVEPEHESRCPPAKARYCNPANPEQTWTGRGKQPEWLREQIANGARLEDLLIGANPSPVALVQDIEQPKHATDLQTVTVTLKDGKWYAMHDDQVASSAQTAFEAVKGVLKRCGKAGVFEINRLETEGDDQVFTIDDSRTADTATVYLTKQADGWIAKTPSNKNVTAAISITGELTALLSAVEGIEPSNAIITETTDDEIKSRGKRRYSIKAAQVVNAAPAHAPAVAEVPAPEEQPAATYAEIIQAINFASEPQHIDRLMESRIKPHADDRQRHMLEIKAVNRRAEIMAANAMRIN